MDPDKALEEMLAIADQHIAELDDESVNAHADTGRLADLVLALDGWLARGGFLPQAWVLARTRIVQESNYLPPPDR